MLFAAFYLLALALLPSAVCFRAAEWLLNRRLWFLVCLALTVLGAGTAYGFLRLTGVVILPGDHTWSMDFFNASWRDDGVRLLMLYGPPFAGTAATLLKLKLKRGLCFRSICNQKEKM